MAGSESPGTVKELVAGKIHPYEVAESFWELRLEFSDIELARLLAMA
jgi:hypothetical protein